MPTGWEGPEISPLKSYLGESLGYAVCGRRFSQPFDPILQVCPALKLLGCFGKLFLSKSAAFNTTLACFGALASFGNLHAQIRVPLDPAITLAY